MLALNFTDYINPMQTGLHWQIFPLLALLAGWVFGGALLIRWSVKRLNRQVKSNYRTCLLVSFLAGSAAAVIAALIVKLFDAIGRASEGGLVETGIVVSILPAFAAGCLVIYAFFDLPKRGIVLAGAAPMAAIMLFSAGIVVACAVPAKSIRIKTWRQVDCVKNMNYLKQALSMYFRAHERHVPASLEDLRADVLARPSQYAIVGQDIHTLLKCPERPDLSIGYFYMPIDPLDFDLRTWSSAESDKTAIRACDYRASHEGRGRAVMFVSFLAGARPRWVPEPEFQDLLKRPENRRFKEALEKAEGKQ
ncbi:MAG: hypothetical protein ACE15C_12085 [Phycisphaerae bacterium]